MARKTAVDRTEGTFRFVPIGLRGLDVNTAPIMLPPDRVADSWNMRSSDGLWRRRRGAKRLAILHDPGSDNGSKVFGADTKYGRIVTNSELLIPKGGFAVRWFFRAVRPASGKTAYIVSNRQTGVAYGVVWLTLSDAGVPTASVRWATGTTSSIAGTALSAGADTALLLIYDPELGTLTLYKDGDVMGTPVTSLGSDAQPSQAAVDWYVGVEFNPSTPGVTADTHFDGAVDAFTGLTLRGKSLTNGSAPLLDVLLKWSLQDWTNPQSSMVLWHYGFDEASGAVMTDSSRHKNHGVYTSGGDAPSNTSAVALPCMGANFVGTIRSGLTGRRTNVVAAGGQLFSEVIRGGN